MRHFVHQRLQSFLHGVRGKELRVHRNFVGRPAIADETLVREIAHAIVRALQGDEALRQLTGKQRRVEMIVGELEFGGGDERGLHSCIVRYNFALH